MTVRLGDDHTAGANPDKHTPRSMVADNDYAVGQLVEAVSNSPIWKSTAIFIIEDDAQNGPDHVDAHRSTCYVISPWIKKGSVDHTLPEHGQRAEDDGTAAGPAADVPVRRARRRRSWIGTRPRTTTPPTAAILPSEKLAADRNPKLGQVKPASPESSRATT